MAIQTPIPPNPIGENFAWRDWLQRLSDRVFGTASTLDVPIQPEFGGTGLTTYNTGDIIYSNATNNLTRLAPPSVNSYLTIPGSGVPVWTASAGIGTVTSVTGTSPVVSSGGTAPAISLAAAYGDTLNPYASKTANHFLAAPNGSAGVPTFRAVVAADIPTLNQNTTGTALNITATSNNTITTLSSLSLPNTQVTGLGTMSTQNVGISTTVALAKLTVTGTDGSLTVSSGIITAYTAPT
jgi:hypothetical protein